MACQVQGLPRGRSEPSPALRLRPIRIMQFSRPLGDTLAPTNQRDTTRQAHMWTDRRIGESIIARLGPTQPKDLIPMLQSADTILSSLLYFGGSFNATSGAVESSSSSIQFLSCMTEVRLWISQRLLRWTFNKTISSRAT